MNHYQLCYGSNSQSFDLSLPLQQSSGGGGRDENTFCGFKSARNRCPYAEALPHYGGRVGGQGGGVCMLW